MGELDTGVLAAYAAQTIFHDWQVMRLDSLWGDMQTDARTVLCLRAGIGQEFIDEAWANIPRAERMNISTYLRSSLVALAHIGIDLIAAHKAS